MWQQLAFLGKGIVVWTGIHYVAVYGYQLLCLPPNLWGLVFAPFMVPAPHCRGLAWLMDISSSSVQGVWTSIGIVLSATIVQHLPSVNLPEALRKMRGQEDEAREEQEAD